MLFMVIERTPTENIEAVGVRFRERGRLMPEGAGVAYLGSWLTPTGETCYQLMEAPSIEPLLVWISHWSDLVRFEIVPVLTSKEFWERRASDASPP